ncbi:MAG: GNAT family N-acetyltransferase [Pyramidobacter sp.]|nr:GNAT family N-acetyltransferase [Pyramidobacter sp.]
MITVRNLSADTFIANPDSARLIEEYRAECQNVGLGITPAPDFRRYRALDAAGMLHVCAAFDTGTMVGFAVVMTTAVPHYAGLPIASTESVFCTERYRSKGVGRMLIRKAREMAKDAGAPGLYVSAPAGSRFERLLELTAKRTNSVFFFEDPE